MQNQILQFYLSHHFMLRGWDRSIDRTLLYKVLPEVTVSKEEKKIAIVTPAFLTNKGICVKEKYCLVIVLKHKLLKTVFWCANPNKLHKKERQAEIEWIFI